MSNESIRDNPYYLKTEQDFLTAYSKRKEMSENFLMFDKVDEIKKNEEKIISLAVQLLKFGVDFDESDDCVSIIVDDDNYKIPKDVLKRVMGDEEYNVLFYNENDEKSDAAEDYGEDFNSYDKYEDKPYSFTSQNSVYGQVVPPNPFQQNPLMAMLSYFMAPYMNYQGENMHSDVDFGNNNRPGYRYGNDKGSGENVKRSDLMRDISNIQRRAINLEKERNVVREELASAKKKIDAIQKDSKDALDEIRVENAAKLEEMTSIVNEKENEIKTISEKLNLLSHEKEQILKDKNDLSSKYGLLVNEKNNLSRENGEFKTKIESLSREMENSKNQFIAKNKEYENLRSQMGINKNQFEAKNRELQSEIDKLKLAQNDLISNATADIRAEKEKVEKNASELEKQILFFKNKSENDLKKQNELTKQIEGLKNEIERLKKETEVMKSEKATLIEQINSKNTDLVEKDKSLNRIKEDLSEMTDLAFTDAKTGVKNLNAFNREFSSINKNDIILSMIGIRNMKTVNNSFGRSAGDQVILNVTKALKESFSSKMIYRIMGDQFIVITNDMKYDDINQNLSRIKAQLNSDSIDIVFGIAVGLNCKDNAEVATTAESIMNKEKDSNPFPARAQPDNYQNQSNLSTGLEEMTAEEMMASYMENM